MGLVCKNGKNIESISIFCGANTGVNFVYGEKAKELGKYLAEHKVRIIYGGSKIGLMGAIADAALEAGGEVVGVIPGFLKTKEVAHEDITELIEVKTMQERKLRMHDLSDAIIAMPGGFGTMEEFFEMLTWAQLGLHKNPIALYNVNGYYTGLAELFELMVREEFLRPNYRQLVIIADSLTELMSKIHEYEPADIKRWIDERET